MDKLKQFFKMSLGNIKRQMISLMLFLLPAKITFMFLEVSLTVMLMKVRGISHNAIDMAKFFKLVNSNYNGSLVDLPYYSIEYIWPKDFFDSERTFTSGKKSIREILSDESLLKKNTNRVVDSMLLNMPFLMRVRIGLGSEKRRKEIRNAMVAFLDKKINTLVENTKAQNVEVITP